jgi:hypothetical protein
MTKKEDIVPGTVLRVTRNTNTGYNVAIDAHLMFSGKEVPVAIGDELEVVRKASKKIDGINLVRVKRFSDNIEGEMYYCDVRYCTEKK